MGEDDGISGNGTSECDCVKSRHNIRLKNLACEFLNEEEAELDDDVALLGVNSTLALKMDEFDDDFCICRRCRTLSSSLSFKSSSYADRRTTISKQNVKSNTTTNNESSVSSAGKKFGSEEAEVDIAGSINNISCVEPTDDDPFILQDSYDTELEESEHCHVTKKSSAAIRKAKKKLMISSFLCLLFMLAEIIGGYLSNSLAVMTDAAHLLSDLASFLISLFAIWVGQKAPTRRMSFGYYRAEVLGAVMSVLLIWVLTAVLVYMAVDRVRYQEYNIDADVMLIVSGCGVAMNIIMGIVLHGPCGNHGHGHSHGIPSAASHIHESTDSHSSQNINVRAAFIHVVGDLVQSLGVLVAAYIIHYKPEYKIADPICTFIFSLLVMITTITIMKDAVHVLMEGFPRDLNYGDIKNSLLSIHGVRAAHNLHIWSLTIDKNSLSVHLAVDPEMDPHKVLRDAQILVRRTYNIYHTTIQVERYNPSAMLDCKVCQGPSV